MCSQDQQAASRSNHPIFEAAVGERLSRMVCVELDDHDDTQTLS